ncbi:hypothetical protein B0H11DRAFT_1914031 [Mycena galericulata]|nr:hypothetical protein B0H11DRAFT_1914031 [Mycena galericulata]
MAFWSVFSANIASARGPSFPVDLEREIFETAALMHPKEFLLFYGQGLLAAFISGTYKIIRASTHSVTALKAKSAPFLHNAVRHLLLDFTPTWSPEEERDILEVCTGVVDFAVVQHMSNPGLLPILADMQLEQLAICLEALFGGELSIGLRHQLFASITHLDIFDSIQDRETCICPPSHGTRWGTYRRTARNSSSSFSSSWPYRFSSVGFEWMKTSPIRDVRLVAALYVDHWDDWERGT